MEKKGLKIALVLFAAILFAILIGKQYDVVVASGIDILAKYKEVWGSTQFLGVIAFVGIAWYFLGRILQLFEAFPVYAIIGVEGICYLGLKYIAVGKGFFGEKVFEAIVFATYRAASVIVLGMKVFTSVHGAVGNTMKNTALAVLGVIVLGGGLLAAIGGFIYLVGMSPVVSSLVCLILLTVAYGILGVFNNTYVFIIGAILITYVIFLGWGAVTASLKIKPFDFGGWLGSTQERFAALKDVQREDFKYLIGAVAATIVVYLFGFFENWNDIVGFVFSSEYGSVTTNEVMYLDGRAAITLIVATCVSVVIGIVLNRFLHRRSIIVETARMLITFVIQVTLLDVFVGWIEKFIYTPFSMEQGQGFLLSIGHVGWYIIGVLAVLVMLLFFGLQCSITIFSCNLIYIILLMNHIDLGVCPPYLLGLLLIGAIQFINGLIVINPFEQID